jgi:hypothetical protein
MHTQNRRFKTSIFSKLPNVRVLERSKIEKLSFERTKIRSIRNINFFSCFSLRKFTSFCINL